MAPKSALPRTDKPVAAMAPARILASAIASQEIEGLHPDPLALAELHQVIAGDLSPSELRHRLLARYRKAAPTG